MGILNVTPDSFSDGGRYHGLENAIDKAACMVNEGADIIDIGGESTRPGAIKISSDEEMSRVMPVIEAIKARFDCAISLDTSKADVMREGLKRGVDIINDINALQADGAMEELAKSKAKVCLMHMQGVPQTMQKAPDYQDVVAEISDFLKGRLQQCIQNNISMERIILDPGLGFGKTLAHNLDIVRNLNKFLTFGCPLLMGASRKSMIGLITDAKIDERLAGSLVLAIEAVKRGATYLRVHDVKETKQALAVYAAVNEE